ncbi:MAG: hypothetical protein HYW50_02905 [Candidatus Diapherotrites archaeon]|nr:hypothetical protein [Candidatus Diapherotrites archaeon]
MSQKTKKLEIEGATVRLKDRHENVVLHASTKRDGYALLTLPAQLPGTTLFLEIEKPLYETKTIELKIRSDIVQINPDRLGVALNTKTLHSAQTQFNLTNLTPFPLKVGKLTFRGEFKNLLDQKATQDSLDLSYKDFVLEAGKTKEFVLKVFLSEEGKGISKRQDIDAFLDLEISNFGKNWPLSIPVRVAIDIEGAVDNPACLVLNRSSWQTTTEGDPVRMELVIENNCTIDGQPIELKKLFAQVQLESNNLGIYEIAIGENKTELASGYDKMLVSRIAGGQRISAILSFTPFGGVNGESTAKIKISATNPQETDEQVLEQAIDAKITIVNLVQCISIDPVLIEITGQGESGTRTEFNINAGNGNVSCGGPVDYLLESELEVTPKEGRIEDGAKQAIKVLRGDAIQGQYPVFVKAKFGSEQEEQLIGTVRVRITEPGCLQLSRYEFDLYDDPLDEFDGLDTTTITNKCFDKPVPVRVNLQSFSEAMKFGSTIGLLTFGVSLLGHGLGTYFGGGGTGTVLYKTENEMKLKKALAAQNIILFRSIKKKSPIKLKVKAIPLQEQEPEM